MPLHAQGEPMWRKGRLVYAVGKEPVGLLWGSSQHTEESLQRIWAENPARGVGLQMGLGPKGEDGLVDLEIDDPAAAQATLIRIFGSPKPPMTASFGSRRGMHNVYRMDKGDAAQLYALGITATVDGKHHPGYAGIELRFGTLNPAEAKATQTAVPPTPFLREDGIPQERAWVREQFARLPRSLMNDLIEQFGHRRASATRSEVGPPPRPEAYDLDPVEMFLGQLDVMGLEVVANDQGWMAQCPVHPDTRPSLSISEGDDGRLLVRCFGCEAAYPDIMAAAGLQPRDGFPGTSQRVTQAARRAAGFGRRPAQITEAEAAAWARESAEYQAALAGRPVKLELLANLLHVTKTSLLSLGIGWKPENRRQDLDTGLWVNDGPCWTFPVRDARGLIVGIMRRYESPAVGKKHVRGSRQGLYLPAGWRQMDGPVYLVEGTSDVAALLSVGRCAIGRPNAAGGVGDLVELLAAERRAIHVVGENDQKGQSWPGKEHAERLARELSRRLQREITMLLPPNGCKDLRAFINSVTLSTEDESHAS